jgi:hypothetical protein
MFSFFQAFNFMQNAVDWNFLGLYLMTIVLYHLTNVYGHGVCVIYYIIKKYEWHADHQNRSICVVNVWKFQVKNVLSPFLSILRFRCRLVPESVYFLTAQIDWGRTC